jgi:hypothetical protein
MSANVGAIHSEITNWSLEKPVNAPWIKAAFSIFDDHLMTTRER